MEYDYVDCLECCIVSVELCVVVIKCFGSLGIYCSCMEK